jgi:hypothetical protein
MNPPGFLDCHRPGEGFQNKRPSGFLRPGLASIVPGELKPEIGPLGLRHNEPSVQFTEARVSSRVVGAKGAGIVKQVLTLLLVTLVSAGTAFSQQIKIRNHNYVAATGKWKSDSEMVKPKDPSANVEIECDKNISLCAVAEGTNLSGDGNLFTRLDVNPVHYTIVHWDSTGLVAQTSARDCVLNKLVIDFRTKSVTVTETPKRKGSGEDNEFCSVFTKTVTSRLVRSNS